jgi:hypothetical protein
MYVNPFWFGVGATIGVEAILLIIVAVRAANRRRR